MTVYEFLNLFVEEDKRIKNAVGIYRKTLASEDLGKLQTEIDKINGIRLMWA